MSESWGTPGGGWGNPAFGSTSLRLPAINSPNFNLANPSASPSPSWAILANGLAYFFGVVLSGGTVTGPDYIINSSGIFFYSGTPATGNLIGSWAAASGTDAFGNAYGAGLTIGNSAGSTPQVALVPSAGGPGSPAEIQFPLFPANFFAGPPNIAASSPSNDGIWTFSGPALAQSGFNDYVQQVYFSDVAGAAAALAFNYIDAASPAVAHTYASLSCYGLALDVVQQIYGLHPGTGTSQSNPGVAESWQAATLKNSWAASGGGVNGVRYRMLPIGAGLIQVEGDIINTTATGNSVCATMGTGYHPPAGRNFPCGWNNPAVNNSASAPWVFVDTSGNIQITGLEVANKGLFFQGFVPMDLGAAGEYDNADRGHRAGPGRGRRRRGGLQGDPPRGQRGDAGQADRDRRHRRARGGRPGAPARRQALAARGQRGARAYRGSLRPASASLENSQSGSPSLRDTCLSRRSFSSVTTASWAAILSCRRGEPAGARSTSISALRAISTSSASLLPSYTPMTGSYLFMATHAYPCVPMGTAGYCRVPMII